MKIVVKDPTTKKAIALLIASSGQEKRIMSPDPENEPYWHHMVRVYQCLIDNGEEDVDTLIAALLHDSVEDGKLTADQIRDEFGENVTKIVQLLSEDEHTDHNATNNRDEYFERIKKYPDTKIRTAAMKIKVADRYDNLLGVSFTDFEDKKKQYIKEVNDHISHFAIEVEMLELIEKGISIVNGKSDKLDIAVEFGKNTKL